MSHIINLNLAPNPELSAPILSPSTVSTKTPYQTLKITVNPFKDMQVGEMLNLYVGGHSIDKIINQSDVDNPVIFIVDKQDELADIFSGISDGFITVQYVLGSRDSNDNLSMPSKLKIDNTAPVVNPPDNPADDISKFYLEAIVGNGISNNGSPCKVRAHLKAKPNGVYIVNFSYYGAQYLTASLVVVTPSDILSGEQGAHDINASISVDQNGMGQVDVWYHSLGEKTGYVSAQAELFTNDRKHIAYTDGNLNPQLYFG